MELLRKVVKEISLPAFAIGGIDFANIDDVLATGIHGVAVSGAFAKASDGAHAEGGVTSVVRDFQKKLQRGSAAGSENS